MDIAGINALTRSAYPARRVETGRLQRATTGAPHGPQPPVEQVLQGELLQNRRKAASYDSADLLDTLQAMDRVLRDSTATTGGAPRDARRAIATYTQQAILSNNRSGASATAIDYFA